MKYNIKNWRNDFAKHGIIVKDVLYINNIPKGYICVTNCSKTKTNKNKGNPRDFYKGTDSTRFIDFFEKAGVFYAILSDLYGIHFRDEILPSYDLSPNQIKNRNKLSLIITEKVRNAGYKGIMYYCPTPSRAKTYLDILIRTKLSIIYVRRLRKREYKNIFNK